MTLNEYLRQTGVVSRDDDCLVAEACENMAGSWLWEGPLVDSLTQDTVVEALGNAETCCWMILQDLIDSGDDEHNTDSLEQPVWSINILKDIATYFRDNDRGEWADQLDKALLFEYIKENA